MFESGSSSSFVFAYQITIATMAILWGITCEKVRELHPKELVKKHLDTAITVLKALALKWPGTEATVDIIGQLSKAAFKSYDVDERARSEKSNSLSPPPIAKSIHRTSQSPVRNSSGNSSNAVEATPKTTPPPPPKHSLPQPQHPLPPPTPKARQSRAPSNTSTASSHHRPLSFNENGPFQSDHSQPDSLYRPESTPSPANTASIASAASPGSMFGASPPRSAAGFPVDMHRQSQYADSASPTSSDYQDINTMLQDPRAIQNIFSEGLDLTSWDPLQMYPIHPNGMPPNPNPAISELPTQSHFTQGYSMDTGHMTSQFGGGLHPETSILEHQAQQMELIRILEQEQMQNYQQHQQNNPPPAQNGDGGLFRGFYFN